MGEPQEALSEIIEQGLSPEQEEVVSLLGLPLNIKDWDLNTVRTVMTSSDYLGPERNWGPKELAASLEPSTQIPRPELEHLVDELGTKIATIHGWLSAIAQGE